MLRIIKWLSSIMCLAFFINNTFAQDAKKIIWQQDYPLSWGNYKGCVDSTSNYSAFTYYDASYTYNWQEINGQFILKFKVVSNMYVDKSWSKIDKRSPALLAHEQLHFDIAEIFARQLSKALNNHFYTSNFRNEIEQIVRSLNAQRDEIEIKYDEQTDHSLNKFMQGKWALILVNY